MILGEAGSSGGVAGLRTATLVRSTRLSSPVLLACCEQLRRQAVRALSISRVNTASSSCPALERDDAVLLFFQRFLHGADLATGHFRALRE